MQVTVWLRSAIMHDHLVTTAQAIRTMSFFQRTRLELDDGIAFAQAYPNPSPSRFFE
jgi:hypothetical protein